MLKTALVLFISSGFAMAELPAKFVRAIHLTETSGRHGAILGDKGKALGPLQVHFSCWADTKLPGRYEDCKSLPYASKVLSVYLSRYCPKAVAEGNFQTMARVWNGGPNGHKKNETKIYWTKVKNNLK